MRAFRAVLVLILATLSMSACLGHHCVEVANGWTFPEFAPDGTPNMVRYRATTFTVCRPVVEWR